MVEKYNKKERPIALFSFFQNFQKYNYKSSRLCIINLSIAKKVTFMDPSPCAGLLYISISANFLGDLN